MNKEYNDELDITHYKFKTRITENSGGDVTYKITFDKGIRAEIYNVSLLTSLTSNRSGSIRFVDSSNRTNGFMLYPITIQSGFYYTFPITDEFTVNAITSAQRVFVMSGDYIQLSVTGMASGEWLELGVNAIIRGRLPSRSLTSTGSASESVYYNKVV